LHLLAGFRGLDGPGDDDSLLIRAADKDELPTATIRFGQRKKLLRATVCSQPIDPSGKDAEETQ
jgi:hypothetical protein